MNFQIKALAHIVATVPDLNIITTECICTGPTYQIKREGITRPNFITTWTLKETHYIIAIFPILKTIFYSSLLTGIAPHDWRTANIISIYANGGSWKSHTHLSHKHLWCPNYLRRVWNVLTFLWFATWILPLLLGLVKYNLHSSLWLYV